MSNTKILNRLVDIIESTLKLPREKIDIDEDFELLGINSLIMMELIESIDQELDVALSPAMFVDVSTLSELATLLESQQGEPAAPALNMLDFIRQKYSVDLAHHGLESVDEMADALLAGHSAQLLRHYGLEEQAGSAPQSRDIAIVGMSCRLPDAPDARALWENLINEKNSAREIPASRWDWKAHFSSQPAAGKTVSKWGALIDDVDCFDPAFFNIPASEAMAMDPQQRLLLQEAYRAVEDAGMDIKTLAGSNTGVFIGYQYSEYEQYLRGQTNQDIRQGPLFSSSSPSYYLANRLSFAFDLRGPSESINVNCASSAVALNRAFYSLVNGETDTALAGGVSLNLFEGDYIASSQYGLLSPTGASGVFDNDANGFTRGEGVAVVVLKRLCDAERDNDRIYAVIKSSHQNYRGAARSLSEIRHESISDVLGECYRKAGVDPATINYIEVDGYATKWADSFEYEGVKNVFKADGRVGKCCALGSLKGNIGNVEAASGVTNLIKLALAMHHKRFPATISKKKINSFIDIDSAAHPLYIADRAIGFETIRKGGAPIRAGINSFADSGSNVHILLEEYIAPMTPAAAGGRELFVLSARNAERLAACVREHIAFLATAPDADFAGMIHTLRRGREAMGERLAVVASSRTELIEKLALYGTAGAMESNEIFRGSAASAAANPLAGLISADMARAQLAQSAQTGQWKQVALLWVNGVHMPWAVLWQENAPRPLSLPGYSFARERYWMDAGAVPPTALQERAAQGVASIADWHSVAADGDAAQASDMDGVAKIALFLRQEVAGHLQRSVEQVDPKQNLIELGMTSIGIAGLIFKIDALLGSNLAPSTLLRHPDIAALSAFLAREYPSRADTLALSKIRPEPERAPTDILVPVQPRGSRQPIFALPGAGGNALSLQQLSHELGSDQPFYCLEPVGLDGRAAPMESVEAIAAFNIKRMKAFQPLGPYRLLGYSNGGVVAFEMARQLLECEDQVASLYMLDSLSPTARAGHAFEANVVGVFNHFASSLGLKAELDMGALLAVPEAGRSQYLHDFLAQRGVDLPKRQFIATFEVATASEHVCRAYRPARLADKVDVVLVKAGNGYQDAPADYGWGQFLRAPVRVLRVEADHFTLIEKGAAADLAGVLGAPPRINEMEAAGAELEEST